MVTKEEARKYLCNAAPEQCFWVSNGQILKNIEELANAMPSMSGDTYSHHVNKDKNDFSNWINDIIGDHQLANELLKSKSKDSAVKKIKERLSSLKKRAG